MANVTGPCMSDRNTSYDHLWPLVTCEAVTFYLRVVTVLRERKHCNTVNLMIFITSRNIFTANVILFRC